MSEILDTLQKSAPFSEVEGQSTSSATTSKEDATVRDDLKKAEDSPTGSPTRKETKSKDNDGGGEEADEKHTNSTSGEESDQEGESQATPGSSAEAASQPSTAWQAIFSPQHNAYYFFNTVTQETTWVNPLQPEASGSGASGSTEEGTSSKSEPEAEASSAEQQATGQAGPGPGSMSHYTALQEAALAQGIDPALAHLDPSLLSGVPGRPVDASGIPLFTAKFNRHTGAFAKTSARDPGHFSEYERAKRMSEFYFDVNQWEDQLASQGGSIKGTEEDQESKKRKRLTKTDMERFKEQKKQKKLAKTAWLRN